MLPASEDSCKEILENAFKQVFGDRQFQSIDGIASTDDYHWHLSFLVKDEDSVSLDDLNLFTWCLAYWPWISNSLKMKSSANLIQRKIGRVSIIVVYSTV